MEMEKKPINKKKIIIFSIIAVVLIVIGISSFFIVKSMKDSKNVETNYNEKNSGTKTEETDNQDSNKEEKEDSEPEEDKNNNKKVSELLKGYSPALNKDPILEEDYIDGRTRMTKIENIENDSQFIQKYQITMNDKTKILEVRYTLNNHKINYLMILDNKIVDENNVELIDDYTTMGEVISNYSDSGCFFEPEQLKIFIGADAKEYAILRTLEFPRHHIRNHEVYIMNDNFEKLSVHLNSGEKNVFTFSDNEGRSINMMEYSSIIGYKIKGKSEEYGGINLALMKDKIKYFDITQECNIGIAEEYEFIIKDNLISPQKIGEYEIHWDSASVC